MVLLFVKLIRKSTMYGYTNKGQIARFQLDTKSDKVPVSMEQVNFFHGKSTTDSELEIVSKCLDTGDWCG